MNTIVAKIIRTIVTLMFVALLLAVPNKVAFAATDPSRYYLADKLAVVNTGYDNGYSGMNALEKDDPHFGRSFVRPYATGFTATTRDSDGTLVLLKNAYDNITLDWEIYENDLDHIFGRTISLSDDTNGYDKQYQIVDQTFGKGCCIIRQTDYNGDQHTVPYTNFIPSIQSGTADTRVEKLQEGDYEVALDYELVNHGKLGHKTYRNYRISFKFKVRNSNCNVYFYDPDIDSNEELSGLVLENGFRIDFKDSHYLSVTVERQVLDKDEKGCRLSTVSSRAVKNGFTTKDEGLYTVTIKNKYTNDMTQHVFSVGNNELLNIYAANQCLISIPEIEERLQAGYKPTRSWTLVHEEAKAEELCNSIERDFGEDIYTNQTNNIASDLWNQVRSAISLEDPNLVVILLVVNAIILLNILIRKHGKERKSNA